MVYHHKSSETIDLERLRRMRSGNSILNNCDENRDDENKSDTTDELFDSPMICYICLDPYSIADKVAIPKHQSCDHIFHKKCITNWLIRQNSCPCCRHPYINIANKDDTSNLLCKTLFSQQDCCSWKSAQFCQIHGVVHPPTDDRNKDESDVEESKTISIHSTVDLSV